MALAFSTLAVDNKTCTYEQFCHRDPGTEKDPWTTCPGGASTADPPLLHNFAPRMLNQTAQYKFPDVCPFMAPNGVVTPMCCNDD